MTSDTDLAWHADGDLLAAYVAGRTRPPVTASVEMHLLHCATCRRGVDALVDPAPLRLVWDRVADDLQVPRRTRTERFAARLGLSDRDALLVAAAPALRGAWLLGLLLCLLFSIVGVSQGEARASLVFLCIAPLIPVGAVAFAYGQDADPTWEITLAAPHPPLRLLLLRAVSVVLVALPIAFVGAAVLPGPPWVAGAWLLPALACAALTLALSTWIPVQHAAGATSLGWVGAVVFVTGPGPGQAVAVLSASVLPVYLAIALAASIAFWRRSDQLSFLGRTP
ncbi:MAG: hypothetical protein ABWX84_08970 [Nocardioides sp.]